jgi:hypothetical protein
MGGLRMNKAYTRINWENEPAVTTPLNATNLNKIDGAVNILDDRIIVLDTNFLELYNQMNVAQSYTPTASNLGTITKHTAMVKSGIGRYKLDAICGTWTANNNYVICTLSPIYRPTITIDKKVIIKVNGSTGVIANFYIGTDGNVVIKPYTAITSTPVQIDETYII